MKITLPAKTAKDISTVNDIRSGRNPEISVITALARKHRYIVRRRPKNLWSIQPSRHNVDGAFAALNIRSNRSTFAPI
jgi:hypothetical protein